MFRFASSLTKSTSHFAKFGTRSISSTMAPGYKVAVVGAAGGIGQPMSLLLKASPLVKELSVYDLSPNTYGVAADLGHINTGASCNAFVEEKDAPYSMPEALKDCDVVVVPAGIPRKDGMTRDDLFKINGGIVMNIAACAALACPNAKMLIISNPVNSTVPIVHEVFKQIQGDKFVSGNIMGVTTLDIVRANTFIAEAAKTKVEDLKIDVVGGHAGITILPLLSKTAGLDDAQREALTKRVMFGGEEVVKAKSKGMGGSATLSMAYAGAHFTNRILAAMEGESVTECTYVESPQFAGEGVTFFSSPCEITKSGAAKAGSVDVAALSPFEKKCLDDMLPDLKAQIAKGLALVNSSQEKLEAEKKRVAERLAQL